MNKTLFEITIHEGKTLRIERVPTEKNSGLLKFKLIEESL